MNQDTRKQNINWLDPNAFVDDSVTNLHALCCSRTQMGKEKQYRRKDFKKEQRIEKKIILETEGSVNTV
jgi:hypothetical protein